MLAFMESCNYKNKYQKQGEKYAAPLGEPDTYNTQSELEMLLSQLEEFNQAITVLAAEKADLSIQLELARSNLSNAYTMLEKMKNDHSAALEEKSKLLEEIDQLVDVINNERLRFKELNEQNEKEREENSGCLRRKDFEIETYKTDIVEKMKSIELLNMRTNTYLTQIEEIKSFSDKLRTEYSSRDQRDNLIIKEREDEISNLKQEIMQLKAIKLNVDHENKEIIDSSGFEDVLAINGNVRKTVFSTSKGDDTGDSPSVCDKKQHLRLIRGLKIEEYQLKINQMQLEIEQTNNSLKQMIQTNQKQQDIISSLHSKLKEKDQHLSKYLKSKQDWEKTISKLRTEVSSLHSQLNELANSDTREKLEAELAMLKEKASDTEKLSQETLLEKNEIKQKFNKLKRTILKLTDENNKKDLQIKKQTMNCKEHNSENKDLEIRIREYESIMQANSKEIKRLLQRQKTLQHQLNHIKLEESVPDFRLYDPTIAVRAQENTSPENILLKEVNQLKDSYDEMQSLCKQLEHKLATERLEEASIYSKHQSTANLNQGFLLDECKDTCELYQDKILSLENELLEAKSSADTIEKLNESYKLDLENENKMRMNECEESKELMKECRAIIKELSLRARQAEEEQNHSLRVIFQLSQRLTRSIQDYKHLEEISMTRCQELALEAKIDP